MTLKQAATRRRPSPTPRPQPVVAVMPLKQAAAILGVTPDNLRGAIARGSLRATKIGRDWTVTPKEVERYRTEHRRAERPVST